MDSDNKKFGRGPRELTGAVDLITHYKLLPHHEFFCKKSLPISISDTHYLHRVVGDTDIRKGDGMQLGQLTQNTSYSQDGNTRIRPFDVGVLIDSFLLNDATPVELPSAEKGIAIIDVKSKDKHKKHKKSKDKDKKDKEHKKHKHRHKDEDKEKKHRDKKRKHDNLEDVKNIDKYKKSKHKTSKVDEMGVIKVIG